MDRLQNAMLDNSNYFFVASLELHSIEQKNHEHLLAVLAKKIVFCN